MTPKLFKCAQLYLVFYLLSNNEIIEIKRTIFLKLARTFKQVNNECEEIFIKCMNYG